MRRRLRAIFLIGFLVAATTHGDPILAQTTASHAGGLPPGLEVCDSDCMTPDKQVLVQHWVFQGHKGNSKWNDNDSIMSTLDIERFDSERVIIHRSDLPGTPLAGIKYVYEGTLREGRIEGTATGTWGRFVSKSNPTGAFSIPWYATIPVTSCEPSEKDAVEVGTKAIRFQQLPNAFQCFLIAAKQGNGQAKGVVGLMYRDGIGTTVDYPEAFRWLKAGAIQGEYNCQVALAQMYAIGIGTAADGHQADLWKEQAENNPVMVRQREQARDRQATQALVFEGLAAVLETAVSPTRYSDW